MKYCSKCGNTLEDDMLFCQKCGTKSRITNECSEPVYNETIAVKSDVYKDNANNGYSHHTSQKIMSRKGTVNPSPKKRKGMIAGMIICSIYAAIFIFGGIASGMKEMTVAFGVPFLILTFMFWTLSKSPRKDHHVILGGHKIVKNIFVLFCVFGALIFLIIGSVMISPDMNGDLTNPEIQIDTENATITDVQKWYENQMPAVSQKLLEYSDSVDGISNMNVTETKFRFGEDFGYYDCHYTVYFACKVNGDLCNGEARGFMKYGDSIDSLTWFHYEIYRESDWETIIEIYDDSYDKIIEDYYIELQEKYE